SGDMLQWMTNGRFKSTPPRVVNPTVVNSEPSQPSGASGRSQSARFSMPFFVHPRPSLDLTPLPHCIAQTGGVAHYAPITAGDYLQQRLREIGLV
ncbi:MAG: 2OG-Fe(II) oxygenase family protein, partial [Synechococcales bacterium]|nr:2OG-Fe(II) oxygenase family protein [Synechococcales bacterium]